MLHCSIWTGNNFFAQVDLRKEYCYDAIARSAAGPRERKAKAEWSP